MKTYKSNSYRPLEPVKMSQKEYADYLGINLKTVQNWESRGTSDTTHQLLSKIAELENENRRLKDLIRKQQLTWKLEREQCKK